MNNTSFKCLHSGTLDHTGDEHSRTTPIYCSTSYSYEDREEILYPRNFNTINQRSVVGKLKDLENTEDGLLLSSGMAAISSTILTFAKQGDHIIFSSQLYGGIYPFCSMFLEKFGISYTFINASDINNFDEFVRKNTRLFYFETPSNPFLYIYDMSNIASLCKKSNIVSVVDNTIATPINQRPVEHGIDVVVHSGTKFLGGHHDLIFGAVLSNRDLIKKIKSHAIFLGGNVNAYTCYMIERSLKTLSLRVEKQNANAMHLVKKFSGYDGISRIYHPSLPQHPNHQIATKQMDGYGSLITVELDSIRRVQRFLKKIKIFQASLSLGGIESTVCVPCRSSHAAMSKEERLSLGISECIIRLSVGIEEQDILCSDILSALQKD